MTRVEDILRLAHEHHLANRLPQAETLYRQVLANEPQHPDALYLLGLLAHQTNRLNDAVTLLSQAAQIAPHVPAFHLRLGNALVARGQIEPAIACYQRATQIDQRDPTLHRTLAIALTKVGRLNEGIASFRAVLSLQPNDADALYNLATALLARGRGREAVPLFQRALEFEPNRAETHCNLGAAYRLLNQLDDAVRHYTRALELKSDYPDALYNLGAVHHTLAQIPESIDCYRRALAIKPDFHVAHSGLLLSMHYQVPFDQRAVYEQSVAWAKRFAEPLNIKVPAYKNTRDSKRRLRIGYVSADFFQHSVAFFLEPILRNYDLEQFDVFCYSDVRRADETTRQLRECASGWRDVLNLPDERVAQIIRADQIDILVDLAGHTAYNRLLAFARKPAPVQVTYLGYPNTTGLAAIDYRLTDALADPPGDDALCVEKLVRLPRTAWCYRPPEFAPTVSELPCLSAGAVTFGCLNNLAKVNAKMVALMARVLSAVPRSSLLLKAPSLQHESVQQRMIGEFASHGIAADRLQFAGFVSYDAHLQHYRQVDIALDTFPYNGTATTCESLFMGVPVITLAGEHHISRVGRSLLTSVGLPELVADSEDRYVELAESLAGDTSRLRELRRTMRDRLTSSQLTGAAAFTRDLENFYRQAWRQWCGK